MRQTSRFSAAWWLVVAVAVTAAPGADQTPDDTLDQPSTRTILIPFDELSTTLTDTQRRVLLPRAEYERLVVDAGEAPAAKEPRRASIVRAEYDVTIGTQRAEFAGVLTVDVLGAGAQTVELALGGVGVRSATLDGKAAPIATSPRGRPMLVLEGKGLHQLTLDLVAPVRTTAARQVLNFQVPLAAATRLTLTAPGDIEIKSGAPVVNRVYDEQADMTRFELLPERGLVSLVMTLNSRRLRVDRLVIARQVIVNELTAAYERLHTTFSMAVLHRPVERFQFAVPAGFEVTEVDSPQLARWAIERRGAQRILDVQLRRPTTETVVLHVAAERAPVNLDNWHQQRLEPRA